MDKPWYETPLGQQRIKEITEQVDRSKKDSSRPVKMHQRMYASARASRLTADWSTSNASADSELVSSLTTLRSRARSLVRDASYAKRAKNIVVTNVIGCGIGMQAQVTNSRNESSTRVNTEIESAWAAWSVADSCHTGGRLEFSDLERFCMGQVFEAGEVFVREHYRTFGDSTVPYALEVIEPERIADDLAMANAAPITGHQIRMGVEVDSFFRPVAYYIRTRHPSEHRFGGQYREQIERVPADQIIHLALIDRWPQTRGEPWMHAVVRRLNDMDGYSEAEIVRARSQATMVGAIETPDDPDGFAEQQEDGSYEMEFETGVVKRLNPGEKLNVSPVNAPNPAMDPFMRYMLREVSSGTGPGIPYASLSGDYSQSNYSSSREATLDSRDAWKVTQQWFIKALRVRVHKNWLRQAVLARSIRAINTEEYFTNMTKFEAVRFKPRGWSWVDPTKEVAAFKEAVKAGFTTNSDVIAQTANGRDLEDVLSEREHELQMMEEKGLEFDTSPQAYMKPPASPPADPPDKPDDDKSADTQDPQARVFSFARLK